MEVISNDFINLCFETTEEKQTNRQALADVNQEAKKEKGQRRRNNT